MVQDAYATMGLEFLGSGNYIAVNRSLITAIGLECAVVIGELASEAMYWAKKGELRDGWFFSTVDNLEEATGLSGHKQRKALENLSRSGYVEIAYRDNPRKRFVRVNAMKLIEDVNHLQSKDLTTSDERIERLAVNGFDGNNHKGTTTTTTTRKKKGIAARFVPPSVDEVREYCQERQNDIDAEAFVDFYASKGWKVGSQPMKDWKACVRTWERRAKKDNKTAIGPNGVEYRTDDEDNDEIWKKIWGGR